MRFRSGSDWRHRGELGEDGVVEIECVALAHDELARFDLGLEAMAQQRD
jgi:hypothetical protein